MSNEKEMPTYTCEKCARTFSQKSHYTAHQKKKYDCSTQTNMAVAKTIIEKEEMKEMNDKYFDISDYKLYELPVFVSAAIEANESLILEHILDKNTDYDGLITYVNINQPYKHSSSLKNYHHHILVLDKGITLTLENGQQLTEKDIKYFPLILARYHKIKISSDTPIKIISACRQSVFRTFLNLKYRTSNNTYFSLEESLLSFSDVISKLHLIEMGEMLSESETLSMLTSSSDDEKKYDGFSHPIVCNDNLDDEIVGRFVDVIILNESVNVILQSRTKERIELSVNDIKYIPIYLLKDTMVSLVYKDVAVVTAITFFKDQFRATTYDYGSFIIQDGFLKKKEPPLVNANEYKNK